MIKPRSSERAATLANLSDDTLSDPRPSSVTFSPSDEAASTASSRDMGEASAAGAFGVGNEREREGLSVEDI